MFSASFCFRGAFLMSPYSSILAVLASLIHFFWDFLAKRVAGVGAHFTSATRGLCCTQGI